MLTKKRIGIVVGLLIIAALVLAVIPAMASPGNPDAPGPGIGFVDEDGDGVCDHSPGGQGIGFIDEDNDGVCDYYPDGQGIRFVDEDGDGVCDRWS